MAIATTGDGRSSRMRLMISLPRSAPNCGQNLTDRDYVGALETVVP